MASRVAEATPRRRRVVVVVRVDPHDPDARAHALRDASARDDGAGGAFVEILGFAAAEEQPDPAALQLHVFFSERRLYLS